MKNGNGNGVLPIDPFEGEIMGCESPYIIVEAETGSGKSTRVPLWFEARGMRVLVTEPLVETVIGTSEYVAELAGCRFGGKVGFRTGEMRNDSPETRILFCTDGLALVRELSGHNRFDVLFIDELHEWNKNQSTLEAWAWQHLQAGDSPFRKIVVLSATLNSAELSRKRGNAPVFKVPGRQFPIEDRRLGSSLEADVKALVVEGFDVLVFQPGEAEIKKTIATLEGCGAELIPFYGKLDRAEKDKAYRGYDRPKVVVSTNALETGRTLLPSTGRNLAVVDSGMERRVELVDGIEGLYLKPIAKARSKQRRGRTGRVGPGIYIDHCPTQDRQEYPVPEILRTRLDQTVLRLAVVGYDAAKLPFFHEIERGTLVDARRSLIALGAMNPDDGTVSKIGRRMARFSVSCEFARMLIEAERLGVVEAVATIAGCLEAGDIRGRDGAWRSLTKEAKSDLLATLDVFERGKAMQAGPGKSKAEVLREAGIFVKDFFRADELRRKLLEATRSELRSESQRFASKDEERQAVLKACIAGMVDHLYRLQYGRYVNGSSTERELARESVVTTRPDWLVGLPFDISGTGKRGRPFTLHIVGMATAVDPAWMVEVAPQLVEKKAGLSPRYDAQKDIVVSITQVFFNGQKVREETVDDPEHPEAANIFCAWLASQMV